MVIFYVLQDVIWRITLSAQPIQPSTSAKNTTNTCTSSGIHAPLLFLLHTHFFILILSSALLAHFGTHVYATISPAHGKDVQIKKKYLEVRFSHPRHEKRFARSRDITFIVAFRSVGIHTSHSLYISCYRLSSLSADRGKRKDLLRLCWMFSTCV